MIEKNIKANNLLIDEISEIFSKNFDTEIDDMMEQKRRYLIREYKDDVQLLNQRVEFAYRINDVFKTQNKLMFKLALEQLLNSKPEIEQREENVFKKIFKPKR